MKLFSFFNPADLVQLLFSVANDANARRRDAVTVERRARKLKKSSL